MIIHNNRTLRDGERRKKRFIVPIIYFIAEAVLFWLILGLIQLEFNLKNWSLWAILIFLFGLTYSIAKTVHVFQRQKDYEDK